jgi:hypothetical protein
MLRPSTSDSLRAVGPATGTSYVFSLDNPAIEVDALDAVAFLRSGRFEHAR